MNRTDLTKRPEELKISKPDLLAIGIGAAAFAAACAAIAYLFQEEDSIPHDPPPIIIKSGSFIIETNQALTPDQPNKRSYKRVFNGIKGIRVVTYNERVKADTDDDYFYEGENNRWRSNDNLKVSIELERCLSEDNNGVCNSWSSPDVIEILNNTNDLEIKVPTPLQLSKSRRNKKNKRSFKHEDEHNEIIRFTKVTIINTSQGNFEIKKYPLNSSETKSREYVIAFYDGL